MRCGELCALRVEDLKLEHGVVEVTRSVWNGIEGPTKTKAGRRIVYLDSVTVKMLREHLDGRKTGRLFESREGHS
jgi:integrase